VEIKPGPELRGNFRRLCSTSKVIFYSTLHSVGRQFKTFKIKYLGAFGLKILSKWREKWDESTGVRPKKTNDTKVIKDQTYCIFYNLSDLSTNNTISLGFQSKVRGHKSLEYCCQLFSNTFDIRRYNFSSVSTISYAESNGGIFTLIAPLIRQYKYYKVKDKRTASDLMSTIQFRLIFKGHKSLEYWCLVIHLTSVSTISYAESNGGIFILIAPFIRGITNTISCFALSTLQTVFTDCCSINFILIWHQYASHKVVIT
jgi:hypothetical protein